MNKAKHCIGKISFSLIAIISLTHYASAALNITLYQDGSDIVVNASGFVDTAGASSSGSVNAPDSSFLPHKQIRSGPFDGDSTDAIWNISLGNDIYQIANGGDLFAEDLSIIEAVESNGDSFGLYASDDNSAFLLYVPENFTSGNIAGTLRFSNVSLQSLGTIEQTVSWGASQNQSVIISVIPEPSYALPLGLFSLLMVRNQKRRAIAAKR
ncbi:hypothetical protein [Coraliomargarita akajimensis]|uniref:PEP-CTERM protein-sorting domain-containing protein n=1 Tax=Coraliomargarita akajimensis (strain DSM 45221 / IAM 15411 / JCM 23193 / KCTC 12865 / 04OKA010-24) TaxID=583355 RepID=D5ENU2_CORAD|nr:hypothetical protein [Coraliomargarita akajimensis]ADE53601.1 hypothetical protein Caka_0576 [Coraliomargarita akajimensis DSM 45221]